VIGLIRRERLDVAQGSIQGERINNYTTIDGKEVAGGQILRQFLGSYNEERTAS